jgi:L-rhamnose-H+ transport protein
MNMNWAKEIIDRAIQIGNVNLSYASNAAIAIVLIGGLIPNVGYCIYLLSKNRSWKLYKDTNYILYWTAILSMGILYSASSGLWGISISESMLGRLGPSIGWGLFIGMMVISSNVCGFLTGEWKNANKKSINFIFISLGLIMLALFFH